MLRGDPSFRRLNPADQQRLMQQLHQVNQMPEDQRQRRLARAEMIERLSPQERMQINLSARRWAYLPPDRQALMKNAFRDLRAVPMNERQTVLNSARYQGVYSAPRSAASSPTCCAWSPTNRRASRCVSPKFSETLQPLTAPAWATLLSYGQICP